MAKVSHRATRILILEKLGTESRFGAFVGVQSAISKCKNCTLDESAVLQLIADNPKITQKQIAEAIKKSERTVKSITVSLQEKGLISRKNGKRNGSWELNES